VRNLAVAGSALVVAGAIGAACTSGGHTSQRSAGLSLDPLPSQAPSGAVAVPGARREMTPTTTPPPPPVTTRITTVLLPAPTVTVRATVTALPPAPPVPVGPGGPIAKPQGQAGAGPTRTAPADSAAAASVPGSGTPVLLSDGSVNCAKSKCIALTFSGGPGPQTRRFLQILADNGGTATFFVTGAQVSQNADVMTAIAGSGNEVANGTWSQPDMTTLGATDELDQLTRTNDAIKETVGVTPTLFRPMGGHSSAAVVRAGKDAGLTQVLWDFDTTDYNFQSDSDGLARVIARAKSGQVVMLHDTFDTTATALAQVLPQLKAQGYAFVTVSQLYRTRG
jgi:peptidoglycan/xylan/chitin deacetylase (PgdA/CDA1 family)